MFLPNCGPIFNSHARNDCAAASRLKRRGITPHDTLHPNANAAKAASFQVLDHFWLRYSTSAINGQLLREVAIESSATGKETAHRTNKCVVTSILNEPDLFFSLMPWIRVICRVHISLMTGIDLCIVRFITFGASRDNRANMLCLPVLATQS
jgi:hypothetical protein